MVLAVSRRSQGIRGAGGTWGVADSAVGMDEVLLDVATMYRVVGYFTSPEPTTDVTAELWSGSLGYS
jgi:hypothetical protein